MVLNLTGLLGYLMRHKVNKLIIYKTDYPIGIGYIFGRYLHNSRVFYNFHHKLAILKCSISEYCFFIMTTYYLYIYFARKHSLFTISDYHRYLILT